MANIPALVPGQPFGSLAVSGLSTVGSSSPLGPPEAFHLQNLYTVSDDVSYNRNKHALKFGVLINRYNQGLTAPTSTTGSVSYSTFANFLMAIPSTYSASIANSDFNRDFIYNTLGFYSQDDWRVASRLMLNLGLRYEFMTTPWELNGKEYALRNYGLDPAFTQGPVMENRSYFNFGPRIGFAWDVLGDGKTAIRGGGGVFYDVGNLGSDFTRDALGHPPFAAISTVNNSITNSVVPFPLVFPAASVGHTINTILYEASQPRIVQYNLTVERQLPARMALVVAYVGSRGVHLWTSKQGNPTIPTFIGPGNKEYWADSTATCSTSVPSCRENPNFASDSTDAPVSDSWYDSLQVAVNKRLSRGLEFQAAYTWSHALDTTEGNLSGSTNCSASGQEPGSDPNFPRTDFGPSCFDLRHNLRFNLLYHFPTIKSGGFLTKFANGWWMGNIVSVQSGYPFTPVLSANRSNNGVGLGGADRVDVGRTTQTVTIGSGPSAHTITYIPFDPNTVITGNPKQWFNPLMFDLAPMVPCPNNPAITCGQLGDAPRGLLRGPGLGEWDFSLVKDTALPFLGELGSLQFRAEFFNILNRANFATPSGISFSGAPTDIGAYSEGPLGTAGAVTQTSTSSRQIQFALKVIF